MFGWWRARPERRVPRDADAAAREALLAVLDRDHERAEELLARACELDSNGVEPYLALARFYRMRGEIGRAIRVHQNLLLRRDLEPEQTIAAIADLAGDFRQGGFLQRAIASYEEVLARDPQHVASLRALVALLADVRDYPRALEMQKALGKLEPENATAEEARLLVDMAEAAMAEGRRDEARKAVRRALKKAPKSVRSWLVLGALEAERGKPKAAIAAWSKIPAIDRRSAALVYPRIQSAYAEQGKPEAYESYLRELLGERDDDAHARMALARALAARGEHEEALAELGRLLEREPENLEARGVQGRLLLAERRDAEATKAYAELLDVLERRGLLRAPRSGPLREPFA